jgi:hypothetical protein
MIPVSTGKRAGSRRAAPAPRKVNKAALLIGAAITVCVIAWGYLVYAAIDFGTDARAGDQRAWWFLATASVGAIACLFLGLVLVARITRALGITRAPEKRPQRDPDAPTGGHRARR